MGSFEISTAKHDAMIIKGDAGGEDETTAEGYFGNVDLGTVHAAGACWQNDRAAICAWEPGEKRYFVQAPAARAANNDSDPAKAPPLSMAEAHRIFVAVGQQMQTNLACHNDNPIHLADYPLDPNVM